jgi:azurin
MTNDFDHQAPLKGFNAFWWGLFGFLAFGVLSVVAFRLSGGTEDAAYVKQSNTRLETRNKVESEQQTVLAGFGVDLSRAAGVFADVKPAKSSKPAIGTKAHEQMMAALMAAAEKTEEKAADDKKEEAAAPMEGEEVAAAKDGGKAEKKEEAFKIALEPEIGLKFKQKEFKVKAGQQVELTFKNSDPTMQIHNVLILKPGTLQKVGALANAMAADPQGMAKSYIPVSTDILHHTSLVLVGKSETIKFKAPDKPDDYPYICTFPGHWMLMQGKMIVE